VCEAEQLGRPLRADESLFGAPERFGRAGRFARGDRDPDSRRRALDPADQQVADPGLKDARTCMSEGYMYGRVVLGGVRPRSGLPWMALRSVAALAHTRT